MQTMLLAALVVALFSGSLLAAARLANRLHVPHQRPQQPTVTTYTITYPDGTEVTTHG